MKHTKKWIAVVTVVVVGTAMAIDEEVSKTNTETTTEAVSKPVAPEIDPYGTQASQAIAQCELKAEEQFPNQVFNIDNLNAVFTVDHKGWITGVSGSAAARNRYTNKRQGYYKLECKTGILAPPVN